MSAVPRYPGSRTGSPACCENERKKDVHERDLAYLEQCYETAQLAARELGWQRIECSGKGEIKSVQEIHLELVRRVKEICDIL